MTLKELQQMIKEELDTYMNEKTEKIWKELLSKSRREL